MSKTAHYCGKQHGCSRWVVRWGTMQRLCEVVLIHLCLSQMAVVLVHSTGFQTRSLLQTASTRRNITVTTRTATQPLWLTMVSIVSHTFNIMWAYHTHSTSCDCNHTHSTSWSHQYRFHVITSQLWSHTLMLGYTVWPAPTLFITSAQQRRLVTLLNYQRHIPDDVSTYSFARM